MKAYKLFKIRKNGTIGPLFINAKQIITIGSWFDAEDHKTKGFAHRPGWHCCYKPVAPHLMMKPKNGCKRVWYEVEIEDFTSYNKPEKQGGVWLLANKMKVIRKM